MPADAPMPGGLLRYQLLASCAAAADAAVRLPMRERCFPLLFHVPRIFEA